MVNNGINIDLRPGIRVVKESYGNREVIWMEEDTIFGSRGGGYFSGILATLLFLVVLFIGLSLLSEPSDGEPIPSQQIQVQHQQY